MCKLCYILLLFVDTNLTPKCCHVEGKEHGQINQDATRHVDVDSQGIILSNKEGHHHPHCYNGTTPNVCKDNTVDLTDNLSSKDQKAHKHINPVLCISNHTLELENQQAHFPDTNYCQQNPGHDVWHPKHKILICQIDCVNIILYNCIRVFLSRDFASLKMTLGSLSRLHSDGIASWHGMASCVLWHFSQFLSFKWVIM